MLNPIKEFPYIFFICENKGKDFSYFIQMKVFIKNKFISHVSKELRLGIFYEKCRKSYNC